MASTGREPVAGTGAFVDYDVLLTAGSGVDGRLDSLIELGTFNNLGVLTTGLQALDLAAEPGLTRLDTTFTRDIPDRRETLRLGDSLTHGGAFAQPVRFGGVQWGSNFATDPSFVTFPTPAIGGLADQDSVVDIFVNNLRQATGEVPSGPFRIDNLPVVTGAGEVQLVVRDLLGRERLITQSYYVSSRLLREGLHDYSYELGFERQRYGERSFAYGDPLVAATHRYGLTEVLTGEVHADAQPDGASTVVGGSWRAGNYGVFSGGVGGSVDDGAPGALGQLAYEYQGSSFNSVCRRAMRPTISPRRGTGRRGAVAWTSSISASTQAATAASGCWPSTRSGAIARTPAPWAGPTACRWGQASCCCAGLSSSSPIPTGWSPPPTPCR